MTSNSLNEKRRMAILAALGDQLSEDPSELGSNLKLLGLMQEISEQSHIHDVEHHPDAKATLEIIKRNKKARQLAGYGFIGRLGRTYRMKLGQRKMTLLLGVRDLKYFER